ncbi:MAG: SH3 domain-containing protein [Caldilineaceae bacterium SB0668_bin_21]|nr:SH3 domain-containing protein [Caldilineaceae bacterium SB0668_bin_21]MYC20493.1 SH3 domain-containing protein [Caldilineaceae bacterium SB0662_bin_25]
MAETLYRRCPGCGQFAPESEDLCSHCGRSFDTLPFKNNARRWGIQTVIAAILFTLLLLSLIFEFRPQILGSPATPVAVLPSTPTPSSETEIREVHSDVASKPTQTPIPEPIVLVERNMNVRGGPGTYYPIVGAAKPGDQFPIIGRNETSDWWRIWYYGTLAWIYAPLVTTANIGDTTIAVFIPPKLTSAQIFQKVSPAIAYVQTEEASGSGVLFEGRYVVTNRHVVYPFDTARVVFPNGAEFDGVPVRGWDLEADLAVLGPVDIATEPIPLIDGETTPIGADMYLIGYPAEFESFPQPTIVKGILSRLRQSDSGRITYFQTDASIAGGQSGGALVSDTGAVIGISGSSIADGMFALVASSADLLPRIRQLIAGGGDPVEGDRRRRAAVNYDGGIDLLGFALEQGEDRLPTQETIGLKPDLPLWVGMRWRTGSDQQVDFAISLRIHDESGNRVFQQDEVLTDSGSRATSQWQEQEPVDTWFELGIPADLPPGVYELRLIVYNIETLTPTVEIEVWEPDVLLARMRWGERQ